MTDRPVIGVVLVRRPEEHAWLPWLAPRLPLPIPVPGTHNVFRGDPPGVYRHEALAAMDDSLP